MDGHQIYANNQRRAFESGLMNEEQAREYLRANPDVAANQQALESWSRMQLEREKQKLEQEKQKAEQMKAQGLNPDGSPIRPEWEGIANPDGSLKEQFTLGNWNAINPDIEALNKFKETALRDAGTDSPWAKVQLERQLLEQDQAMDQTALLGQNSLLQQQSQLAQTGGMSGSARERMAKSAMRDGLLARQNTLREGLLDRNNIRLQDEASRMNQLGTLQGMQNNVADYALKNQERQALIDQYNVGNRIGEVDKKRNYNLEGWKTGMETWAAGKTADAQAKAARSGGK